MERCAVGVRVKTGWAMAVLVGGSASAPRVLDRRRIALADPAEPDSVQPYHAAFAAHTHNSAAEVARLVRIVERFGARSTADLLNRYRDGRVVVGVGVVVGSDVDPATIRNDHIRAHAEEGRLFRSVIERTAANAGLATTVLVEKRLHADAARALGGSEAALKRRVAALGADVEGTWRAEEKGAALAAWMLLGRPHRRGR